MSKEVRLKDVMNMTSYWHWSRFFKCWQTTLTFPWRKP